MQVLLNCMELRKYWISFRDVEGELKLFTCPRIPSGICLRHYQTFSGLDEGFNICNSYIFLTPVTWSCPPPPRPAHQQELSHSYSETNPLSQSSGTPPQDSCRYSAAFIVHRPGCFNFPSGDILTRDSLVSYKQEELSEHTSLERSIS